MTILRVFIVFTQANRWNWPNKPLLLIIWNMCFEKKFVGTHVILTTFTSSQFHCIWVDSDVKKLWHPNVCRDCKLRVQTWRLSDMVIIASQLCVHYWNWNMIKYVSTTLRLTRFCIKLPSIARLWSPFVLALKPTQ